MTKKFTNDGLPFLKSHLYQSCSLDSVCFRLTVSSICLLVYASVGGTAVAQTNSHTGRITKSFTEPIEKSVTASPEPGIVSESFVKEGDRVKVGDRLAAINHTVLKESLAIAIARAESTARLDAAKSQLALIKSQLEAIQSLVAGGHTNQFEVDQKKAEYAVTHAELRTAEDEQRLNELEVARIRAQLNDRFITSPIEGFVTEVHKQPGENISNNEPEYATVVRVDQLKVRFYLDSKTLQSTAVGDMVNVFLGRSSSRKDAKVTYVSPVIDPDSGLGRLDVVIENSDLQIQSGVTCLWEDESLKRRPVSQANSKTASDHRNR